MNNNFRNFGLVCGGIAGLGCVAGGIAVLTAAVASGDAIFWGMGLFFVGMGFFVGPAMVILTLANTEAVEKEVRTAQKTAGKKASTKKADTKKPAKKDSKSEAKGGEDEPVVIYAGNLPHEAGEAEIRAAFEAFGKVDSVRVITHRSGKSKGYGFVDMPDRAEAEAAIEALNGRDFGGRKLKVSESRSKVSRQRARRKGGNDRPKGKSQPNNKPDNKPSDEKPVEVKREPEVVDWDASVDDDR
ncbi:splicing factor, CC1-like family [Anaerohalosphaera lusitana]|uniref:Splicing factor, CC1-like family n=1 Tax=Anaerohalosphaera lusitana TaxID=1936003 RepID=A0A1U9NGM0_9BACT|nr:RNA-binding protein [Anaerohalosphaera lusitana]AQT66955.1 splicing factor, CC1-like family [Anaerohalosphaera lusitana]